MTLAIAALLLGDAPPEWILGVGAGRGRRGDRRARSRPRPCWAAARWPGGATARGLAYALAAAAAAALAGPYVVLVLSAPGCASWPGAAAAGAAVHAWPVVLAAAAALPGVAWMALKVGALSYGGGFVIIPLMQGDAVDRHGWMTATEFVNAIAFGQLTPGPVTHTVALVGWAAAGLGGRALASAIAFAPSFLMILLGGERFGRLRDNRAARAFLDGAAPAAAGAIAGAAVPLLGGLAEAWQLAVLGVAGGLLLAPPGAAARARGGRAGRTRHRPRGWPRPSYRLSGWISRPRRPTSSPGSSSSTRSTRPATSAPARSG